MYKNNWKIQRQRKAFIALGNGEVFRGWSFGAPVDQVGELVFNTGMSGYQEIISDPSYAGQFVTLTSPEIGNYGCNREDMESRGLFLNGLVIHELNMPSNFRSEQALDNMLKEGSVPAIAGVDTRRLTILLRSQGTQKAFMHCSDEDISVEEAAKRAREWCGLDNQDYASKVSCDKAYKWNETGKYKIVALDFGVKYNILRQLAANGMQVTVVPAKTTAAEIMAMKPDGVFLSNGPADPSAVKYAIENARELLGKVPLMGICLGHQILGIANGCKCGRLKFGHHGCNHPVKNLAANEVEITSQNHNFALSLDDFPEELEITHMNLNDNTVEGIRHKSAPMFSVQYHPEAAPGPHDSAYLFNQFLKLLERK
jgi:carbamoyl-phosphate synthase small subunit